MKLGHNISFLNLPTYYDWNLDDKIDNLGEVDTALVHGKSYKLQYNGKNFINKPKKIILCDWWEGGNEARARRKVNSIVDNYDIDVDYITQNKNLKWATYFNLTWKHKGWWHKNVNQEVLESLNLEKKYKFNFIVGKLRWDKKALLKKLNQRPDLMDQSVKVILDAVQFKYKVPRYLKGIYDDMGEGTMSANNKPLLGMLNALPSDLFKGEVDEYAVNPVYCTLLSRFSLVIESEMAQGEVLRYTEKTIKPIQVGQPFIVAGNKGVLKLLRDDGFKTFHPYIDESYDQADTLEEKLDMVIRETERLCMMNKSEWNDFLNKVSDILEHNQNHLRNKEKSFTEDFNKILHKL